MSTPRHTSTPIRRISRGSLTAGSGRAHEPTPLSFLQNEALPILTEETNALQDNLEQMGEIEHALTTFNENFAMFLYGLKMNAFCVEWPEAPVEENLRRYEAQRASGKRTQRAAPTWTSPPTSAGTGDQTYVTEAESPEVPRPRARMNAGGRAASQARARAAQAASARASHARPPPTDSRASQARPAPGAEARAAGVGKQRIPVVTKRKREDFAARIIDTMPLEYRGGDTKQHALLQSVILALISVGNAGLRVSDIAKAPELPAGKVNKALIALLAARHVTRSSDRGVVYRLDPARHPKIP